MEVIKIGIPRALLFYEFSTLWTHFFKNLGTEVILSNRTNKKVLNKGTAIAVDDACIPVKLAHGHVLDLIERVDYIFMPRIIGLSKGDYICPKFCGLPEMIKFAMDKPPQLISTTIDLTKSHQVMEDAFFEIGHFITDDKNLIKRSYHQALENYKMMKEQFKKGMIPREYIKEHEPYQAHEKPTVMVMGHPYVLYDPYLNMNLIKKLQDQGFQVMTPEMIEDDSLSASSNYQGKIFWRFSRSLIGTSYHLIDQQIVDGVIYLSSFGCGIDSIVADSVERRIRKANIPYMLITIDEHSGEAGFNTRLEAYIDLLKWRIENENNLPTHGEYLCAY
jgi:predicted nucleotide-binding protein (sugar kinase/HSP70/actin superfamily)